MLVDSTGDDECHILVTDIKWVTRFCHCEKLRCSRRDKKLDSSKLSLYDLQPLIEFKNSCREAFGGATRDPSFLASRALEFDSW